MHYGEIKDCDIANGIGVRISLFVSGCRNRCPNCFQPQTWDFTYGDPFTVEAEDKILSMLRPAYIQGLTVLGGEPMEIANQRGIYPLVMKFKKIYPQKNIWCYSGYTYEQLSDYTQERCHCDITDELLAKIDILVDGQFVDALKDITLRFRGSSNQRIIDVKRTITKGEVVIWEDNPVFSNHSML